MSNFYLNKKLFLLSILFLFACHSVFANPWKHFSDYTDIKPTRNSDPSIFRTHYHARLKMNDRTPDPLYKKNKWKLVMRRGIFLAQVDQAMSGIYRYFLGYSTDVDIVEEKGDFFIARRELKSFRKMFDNKVPWLIRKEGSKFLVDDVELLDDGRLANNGSRKFKGLASIAVLTRFFGETDAEDFNYGFQVTDAEIKAIFYDCEHSLDFDEENKPDSDIENNLILRFGNEFVNMSWYLQEKRQMLKKIAETDFSIIESIIRKNITGSKLDEGRWVLNKILKDPAVMPDFDRNEARKQLEELNQLDDKDYGVDQIIQELRTRHEKLRKQIAEEARL